MAFCTQHFIPNGFFLLKDINVCDSCHYKRVIVTQSWSSETGVGQLSQDSTNFCDLHFYSFCNQVSRGVKAVLGGGRMLSYTHKGSARLHILICLK